MAAKKRATRKTTRKTARKRAARPDRAARVAMATGEVLASEVLRLRNASLRKRADAVRRAAPRAVARARAVPVSPRLIRAAGAPSPLGVLLAEGDSWFDYPWNDVLKKLEEDHGYDVESVAHMGDRVEDIAYSGKQFEKFAEELEKLLRRSRIPRAILLSGGGNDVAGDEFAMLLEHARSPKPGLNDNVLRGIIDERIRNAYITLITAVTALCQNRTGTIIPIILHGYDRPVPDGRGFGGGWGPLPGPWLEPGFRQKGFDDLLATTIMAGELIDRFNQMMRRVASAPGFDHVRYVDLRGTLSNGPNYRTWWANELHPTGRGFAAVAQRFAAVIART